jgi:hypothetical protein
MTAAKQNKVAALVDQLKTEMETLRVSVAEKSPSQPVRRRLENGVREVVDGLIDVLRELDPVRQPRFVFDAGNPAVVGRFVALAMIAQPREPLASVERFYGSGVYALYYKGDFANYAAIRGSETPIYVGKADPATSQARTPMEQAERLAGRLKDHRRNVIKAENLAIEDFECRFLVVQSGWQEAAESYLINLFKPIWNDETGICYGFGKHGDDPGTRANKRSPWDTLHPGRDWAHRDAGMADAKSLSKIQADLAAHFERTTVFGSLDEVLASFIEQLRQM